MSDTKPPATETMPCRKYTLVRISAGDYLLNSNDGKTLWRISNYIEGPSTGITEWRSDRKVWGYWKWIGGNEVKGIWASWADTEMLEFDNWELCGSMFSTRQAAVKSLLEVQH